ncbi:hypothetical protein NQD34_002702 [Periophthalmus magnuspinnatus]|nr:hypothetical protein NQD34_002702 [Periophthalmus magnuspinnatus]
MMYWTCRCIPLWTLVVFTSGTKAGLNLSEEDVLLLKDEPNPKCLTRMLDPNDFTCFFKTKDNASYNFYYTIDNPPRRTRCELHLQTSADSDFLHVCSFPESDVFLFDDILLEVLDQTNSSLYTRTVTVEDNILPEPPDSVSITQTENIRELKISWKSKCTFTSFYKIRLASKTSREKIKQNKFRETLTGLLPGEQVKVQVCVRCSPSRNTGHWSRWTAHVQAVVPQSAEDVSLQCHTEDLRSITCRWDGSRYHTGTQYRLYYKTYYNTGLSDSPGWTKWTECFPEDNRTDLCVFYGDEHNKLRVKVSNPLAPLNRTFYSEDFKLNHIIKPPAPSRLKQNETDKLCVSWDPPLPALLSHLQYDVSYKPAADQHWMTLSLTGPETAVCLKVSWSCPFNVKIRAKAFGPLYSGQWSDWSCVLTADVPGQYISNKCQILFSDISTFFYTTNVSELCFCRKLKQYFWPPVPNLDKILQDFLSDLNQHKWEAPPTAKQLYSESTASVIEVLSKDYDSGVEDTLDRCTSLLSSSDTSYSSMGQENDSMDAELYPDYVALNKNTVIMCSKDNSYIYEDLLLGKKKEDGSVKMEPNSTQPSEDSLGTSDFLNHSYLLLATDSLDCKENEQRHGNIYTNMPWK